VNSFDYKINDIYDILIVNEVISVRKLFILRGAMASGKSTFIKNNDLEDFTLSADRIRLMYNSPEMTVNYNEMIPQYNNTKVWNLLFQILEDRMRKGELTEYSNA
jgi:2,3-cyclic nucleotide 3-phosphodiesterase